MLVVAGVVAKSSEKIFDCEVRMHEMIHALLIFMVPPILRVVSLRMGFHITKVK